MQWIRSRKIKFMAVCTALVFLAAGCDQLEGAASGQQTPGTADAGNAGSTGSVGSSLNTGEGGQEQAAVVQTSGYTTEYAYQEEDIEDTWDDKTAVQIHLDGDDAEIADASAVFSNGMLTIKRAGTYVVTGTLSDGQIYIDVGKEDVIRLVLNGVSLHNADGSAVYAPQAGKLVLILAEGSVNTISDGSTYAVQDNGDEPDSAIYVQDDLSITGSGTLLVEGNYNHGIRCQDYLVVTGGNIQVTSAGDALRGRDGTVVADGTLELTALGDGIQANNADEDASGFIIINGGTIKIDAQNDGMQAESSITVTGGDIQITTGGGAAAAPEQESDFFGGFGRWGGTSASTSDTDTISKKALKAGKQLYLLGGSITVDAEDDALHSNGQAYIASGVFSIKTGDDGIHADEALVIAGGSIDITDCYEGIEGLSVTVAGGSIAVVAADDAVNAAGGADNASTAGGPMGFDSFSSNGDIFIKITGGTLDLYASYDGIDANGDIYLEGGSIFISGPSQGMDGAIDLDGSIYVTGGELITAGSVASAASSSSTQPVLLVSYGSQQAAGSQIAILDEDGNTILAYQSKTAYAMSGFTSPKFLDGGTYSLYINGEKKTDITLNGTLTSTSDTGGAYSGTNGRGGFGGQRPNGGGRGGFGGTQ